MNLNNQPRMVLIDLDGTLVDSVPDLAYCVDEMMLALGLPIRGEVQVRQWVGNGVERLVKRALLNQLDGEPAAAAFERALPVFLVLFLVFVSLCCLFFFGEKEGLDFLRGA